MASLSVVLKSCECTPVVVRSSDDCSLPVDINSMSTVPEHPEYLDDWKVSIVILTCIVNFTVECS